MCCLWTSLKVSSVGRCPNDITMCLVMLCTDMCLVAIYVSLVKYLFKFIAYFWSIVFPPPLSDLRNPFCILDVNYIAHIHSTHHTQVYCKWVSWVVFSFCWYIKSSNFDEVQSTCPYFKKYVFTLCALNQYNEAPNYINYTIWYKL